MAAATSRLRSALSRYALGLWFCAIAALGLLRVWMKIVREGQAPWPPDLWPWIVGSALCAAVGVAMLVRERRRHALDLAHSAEGDPASYTGRPST